MRHLYALHTNPTMIAPVHYVLSTLCSIDEPNPDAGPDFASLFLDQIPPDDLNEVTDSTDFMTLFVDSIEPTTNTPDLNQPVDDSSSARPNDVPNACQEPEPISAVTTVEL